MMQWSNTIILLLVNKVVKILWQSKRNQTMIVRSVSHRFLSRQASCQNRVAVQYHWRNQYILTSAGGVPLRDRVGSFVRGIAGSHGIDERSDNTGSSSSSNSASSSTTNATEWRKHQLDKLEQKFADSTTTKETNSAPDILTIESEDDLQPMWKQMESRVIRRRSRTLAETGGRSGRSNIKKTDEEMWLKEGLYDDKDG